MRKAKFLKTGEIVNVHNIDYCGQGMDVALIERDGLMKNVSLYDLQFIDSFDEKISDNIDWEQRRYEIAKSAMQGLCSVNDKGSFNNINEFYERTAMHSINIADELIRQLKQTNEAK